MHFPSNPNSLRLIYSRSTAPTGAADCAPRASSRTTARHSRAATSTRHWSGPPQRRSRRFVRRGSHRPSSPAARKPLLRSKTCILLAIRTFFLARTPCAQTRPVLPYRTLPTPSFPLDSSGPGLINMELKLTRGIVMTVARPTTLHSAFATRSWDHPWRWPTPATRAWHSSWVDPYLSDRSSPRPMPSNVSRSSLEQKSSCFCRPLPMFTSHSLYHSFCEQMSRSESCRSSQLSIFSLLLSNPNPPLAQRHEDPILGLCLPDLDLYPSIRKNGLGSTSECAEFCLSLLMNCGGYRGFSTKNSEEACYCHFDAGTRPPVPAGATAFWSESTGSGKVTKANGEVFQCHPFTPVSSPRFK